jgi:cysteinyl-tRNA synthetase
LQDCEDALSPFQEGSLKEGPEQKGKTARVTAAAQECISKLRSEFQSKMSDDLNTAQILTGAFQEALKFINSSLTALKVHV